MSDAVRHMCGACESPVDPLRMTTCGCPNCGHLVMISTTMPVDGKSDMVNHPKHYNAHPSGVECIVIVEHMTFCAGSAVKYLWRAGLKGNDAADARAKHIEDLRKAEWYIRREIERLSKEKTGP